MTNMSSVHKASKTYEFGEQGRRRRPESEKGPRSQMRPEGSITKEGNKRTTQKTEPKVKETKKKR